MDILLIDPPYKSLKGVGAECAYSAGTVGLAAYLRAAGIDTAVLTGDLLVDLPPGSLLNLDMKAYAEGQEAYMRAVEDADHEVWTRMADEVRKHKPTAVGIAYLTPTKHAVERTASVVKKVDPDIRVIVGGHHATFCPDDALQNADIDLVVRGEGEIPLLQAARALRDGGFDGSTLPGVSCRDAAGRVVHADPAELIPDLDDLPFPARDLVLGCDYADHPVHYMVTARGCPYSCSFCSDRRLWRGKVRRRSLDSVFAELRELVDSYPVRFIDFVDGTFTYDPNYLRGFCERMVAEHPGGSMAVYGAIRQPGRRAARPHARSRLRSPLLRAGVGKCPHPGVH
jgi:anaerobic magnesium-protoporphyrin IX monomethyl ester cyclase